MSDENRETEAPASEEDRATSEDVNPGASGDGSGGGTEAAEAARRAQEELRSAQSARDRLRSEVEQLEARKAELDRTEQTDMTDTDSNKPLTLAEVAALLDERDREAAKSAALTGSVASLREKYGMADGSIFERATEFDSPEALQAAAEASHNSVKAIVDSQVQERLQKAGINPPPPADDGQAPAGDPTIEQLNAMSPDEFDAVSEEVVERVIRSAETVR